MEHMKQSKMILFGYRCTSLLLVLALSFNPAFSFASTPESLREENLQATADPEKFMIEQDPPELQNPLEAFYDQIGINKEKKSVDQIGEAEQSVRRSEEDIQELGEASLEYAAAHVQPGIAYATLLDWNSVKVENLRQLKNLDSEVMVALIEYGSGNQTGRQAIFATSGTFDDVRLHALAREILERDDVRMIFRLHNHVDSEKLEASLTDFAEASGEEYLVNSLGEIHSFNHKGMARRQISDQDMNTILAAIPKPDGELEKPFRDLLHRFIEAADRINQGEESIRVLASDNAAGWDELKQIAQWAYENYVESSDIKYIQDARAAIAVYQANYAADANFHLSEQLAADFALLEEKYVWHTINGAPTDPEIDFYIPWSFTELYGQEMRFGGFKLTVVRLFSELLRGIEQELGENNDVTKPENEHLAGLDFNGDHKITGGLIPGTDEELLGALRHSHETTRTQFKFVLDQIQNFYNAHDGIAQNHDWFRKSADLDGNGVLNDLDRQIAWIALFEERATTDSLGIAELCRQAAYQVTCRYSPLPQGSATEEHVLTRDGIQPGEEDLGGFQKPHLNLDEMINQFVAQRFMDQNNAMFQFVHGYQGSSGEHVNGLEDWIRMAEDNSTPTGNPIALEYLADVLGGTFDALLYQKDGERVIKHAELGSGRMLYLSAALIYMSDGEDGLRAWIEQNFGVRDADGVSTWDKFQLQNLFSRRDCGNTCIVGVSEMRDEAGRKIENYASNDHADAKPPIFSPQRGDQNYIPLIWQSSNRPANFRTLTELQYELSRIQFEVLGPMDELLRNGYGNFERDGQTIQNLQAQFLERLEVGPDSLKQRLVTAGMDTALVDDLIVKFSNLDDDVKLEDLNALVAQAHESFNKLGMMVNTFSVTLKDLSDNALKLYRNLYSLEDNMMENLYQSLDPLRTAYFSDMAKIDEKIRKIMETKTGTDQNQQIYNSGNYIRPDSDLSSYAGYPEAWFENVPDGEKPYKIQHYVHVPSGHLVMADGGQYVDLETDQSVSANEVALRPGQAMDWRAHVIAPTTDDDPDKAMLTLMQYLPLKYGPGGEHFFLAKGFSDNSPLGDYKRNGFSDMSTMYRYNLSHLAQLQLRMNPPTDAGFDQLLDPDIRAQNYAAYQTERNFFINAAKILKQTVVDRWMPPNGAGLWQDEILPPTPQNDNELASLGGIVLEVRTMQKKLRDGLKNVDMEWEKFVQTYVDGVKMARHYTHDLKLGARSLQEDVEETEVTLRLDAIVRQALAEDDYRRALWDADIDYQNGKINDVMYANRRTDLQQERDLILAKLGTLLEGDNDLQAVMADGRDLTLLLPQIIEDFMSGLQASLEDEDASRDPFGGLSLGKKMAMHFDAMSKYMHETYQLAELYFSDDAGIPDTCDASAIQQPSDEIITPGLICSGGTADKLNVLWLGRGTRGFTKIQQEANLYEKKVDAWKNFTVSAMTAYQALTQNVLAEVRAAKGYTADSKNRSFSYSFRPISTSTTTQRGHVVTYIGLNAVRDQIFDVDADFNLITRNLRDIDRDGVMWFELAGMIAKYYQNTIWRNNWNTMSPGGRGVDDLIDALENLFKCMDGFGDGKDSCGMFDLEDTSNFVKVFSQASGGARTLEVGGIVFNWNNAVFDGKTGSQVAAEKAANACHEMPPPMGGEMCSEDKWLFGGDLAGVVSSVQGQAAAAQQALTALRAAVASYESGVTGTFQGYAAVMNTRLRQYEQDFAFDGFDAQEKRLTPSHTNPQLYNNDWGEMHLRFLANHTNGPPDTYPYQQRYDLYPENYSNPRNVQSYRAAVAAENTRYFKDQVQLTRDRLDVFDFIAAKRIEVMVRDAKDYFDYVRNHLAAFRAKLIDPADADIWYSRVEAGLAAREGDVIEQFNEAYLKNYHLLYGRKPTAAALQTLNLRDIVAWWPLGDTAAIHQPERPRMDVDAPVTILSPRSTRDNAQYDLRLEIHWSNGDAERIDAGDFRVTVYPPIAFLEPGVNKVTVTVNDPERLEKYQTKFALYYVKPQIAFENDPAVLGMRELIDQAMLLWNGSAHLEYPEQALTGMPPAEWDEAVQRYAGKILEEINRQGYRYALNSSSVAPVLGRDGTFAAVPTHNSEDWLDLDFILASHEMGAGGFRFDPIYHGFTVEDAEGNILQSLDPDGSSAPGLFDRFHPITTQLTFYDRYEWAAAIKAEETVLSQLAQFNPADLAAAGIDTAVSPQVVAINFVELEQLKHPAVPAEVDFAVRYLVEVELRRTNNLPPVRLTYYVGDNHNNEDAIYILDSQTTRNFWNDTGFALFPGVLSNGTEDEEYLQTFEMIGGDRPITFAGLSGAPDGMVLLVNDEDSGNGIFKLKWPAPVTGDYEFKIRVKDTVGNDREFTYKLRIDNPSYPPIVIQPGSLPDGKEGEEYSEQLMVSGGSGVYPSAELIGAPEGMTLNLADLASGNVFVNWPAENTAEGDYSFQIKVTDHKGNVKVVDFTLHMNAKDDDPRLRTADGVGEVQFITDNIIAANWWVDGVQATYLIDLQSDEIIATLEKGGRIDHYSVSPNRRYVSVGYGYSPKKILVYDTVTHERTDFNLILNGTPTTGMERMRSLAVTDDGNVGGIFDTWIRLDTVVNGSQHAIIESFVRYFTKTGHLLDEFTIESNPDNRQHATRTGEYNQIRYIGGHQFIAYMATSTGGELKFQKIQIAPNNQLENLGVVTFTGLEDGIWGDVSLAEVRDPDTGLVDIEAHVRNAYDDNPVDTDRYEGVSRLLRLSLNNQSIIETVDNTGAFKFHYDLLPAFVTNGYSLDFTERHVTGDLLPYSWLNATRLTDGKHFALKTGDVLQRMGVISHGKEIDIYGIDIGKNEGQGKDQMVISCVLHDGQTQGSQSIHLIVVSLADFVANLAGVRGPVEVTSADITNNIDAYELKLTDGVQEWTITGRENLEALLVDTSEFVEGDNNLLIRVTDSDGVEKTKEFVLNLFSLPPQTELTTDALRGTVKLDFDAKPRAKMYWIQISTDPNFNQNVQEHFLTAPPLELTLDNDGTYYIRLRASSEEQVENGVLTAWTSVESFDMSLYASRQSVIESPAQDALEDEDVTIQFTDIPDTVVYQVQVSRAADFSDIIHEGFPNVSQETIPQSALDKSGKLYVRVRGSLNSQVETGPVSQWSEIVSFEVDVKKPTGYAVINDGKKYTRSRTVDLKLDNIGDDYSGIVSARYSINGVAIGDLPGFDPSLPTQTISIELPQGDGLYNVEVVLKDKVGHESRIADEIILDTTPPKDPVMLINGGAKFATAADFENGLKLTIKFDDLALDFDDVLAFTIPWFKINNFVTRTDSTIGSLVARGWAVINATNPAEIQIVQWTNQSGQNVLKGQLKEGLNYLGFSLKDPAGNLAGPGATPEYKEMMTPTIIGDRRPPFGKARFKDAKTVLVNFNDNLLKPKYNGIVKLGSYKITLSIKKGSKTTKVFALTIDDLIARGWAKINTSNPPEIELTIPDEFSVGSGDYAHVWITDPATNQSRRFTAQLS